MFYLEQQRSWTRDVWLQERLQMITYREEFRTFPLTTKWFINLLIRIILDRASSHLDPVLREMDSSMQSVCGTRTSACPLNDPVTLEHDPSLTSRTTTPSLTKILNNIQTLRRFFYRPKPLQDQREGGRGTAWSSVEDNRLTSCLSPDSTTGSGELSGQSCRNYRECWVLPVLPEAAGLRDLF